MPVPDDEFRDLGKVLAPATRDIRLNIAGKPDGYLPEFP